MSLLEQIMRHGLLLRVLIIVLATLSSQTFGLTVSGSFSFDESTKNISAIININDSVLTLSKSHFTMTTPDSDLYRIKIDVEGYYSSFQTFSHQELLSKTEANSATHLQLPDIELVKRKDTRVMLAFGGDVMMGRRYSKPYFNDPVLIRDGHEKTDTRALVQYVKPYMALADFAAVNLETQISDSKPENRAPKGVTFFSPPETLNALKWSGVDYVTLGNNHIYDYLEEGLTSTLSYLDDSGIAYSGAGLNQQQALEAYRTEINQQNYAMLGFVGWAGGFNPNQVAEKSKGGSALGTQENIVNTVERESQSGRTTVVQYHGSLEYSDEPTGMTESRLKSAIDQGADLVIAHHPHVTQGFEIYKNKLIAYSMGNFIFDQYFHASPHSYVLYVWMDGEKFYRAEVVPIYLKGYAPVPATGIQRSTVTKRTHYLSQLRGVNFSASGGHMVLRQAKSNSVTKKTELVYNNSEKIQNVYRFPVLKRIQKVESKVKDNRYRLGQNQLNGGDFESYKLFSSDERSWLLDNAQLSSQVAASGTNSIAMMPEQESSALVGMKTFRRVFDAGNPMSFTAKVLNTKKPIKARLLFQKRRSRDKFLTALENNEKKVIKEVIISPDEHWQKIEIDFNTPRVGYRSYRVLLELSVLDDKNPQPVYVDDIELVKWQAHYNEFGKLPLDKSLLHLATHLGLEKNATSKQSVILSYVD